MQTNRCDEIVRLIDDVLADYEQAARAAPPQQRHRHQQPGQRPPCGGPEAILRDDGTPALPPARGLVALEGRLW